MVLPQADPDTDDIFVPETKPATEWVNGGRVGAELDVRFRPSGERWRLLVPDVAFISLPRVPPEFAFEVLSPGERFDDVADKIRVYLQCGVNAAVYTDGMTFSDDALPGLQLDVTQILGADRAKR